MYFDVEFDEITDLYPVRSVDNIPAQPDGNVPLDAATKTELKNVDDKIPVLIDDAVSEHDISNESHSDIRLVIENIINRLNAIADSEGIDLDRFSEVVAYIKNNGSILEQVTTGKVNVTDIINNLTTNVVNKPLSAAQGVVLKASIDALMKNKLDISRLNEAITEALQEAKDSGQFDGAPDGVTVEEFEELKEETNAKFQTIEESIPTTPEEVGAQPAGNYLTEETDPTVPSWAKEETKPTYTPQEVGADPTGTAENAVSTHNAATDAHNDIRLLIEGLTTRLNTIANSIDGGYYIPTVTQPKVNTMRVSFTASKEGMADVEETEITIPTADGIPSVGTDDVGSLLYVNDIGEIDILTPNKGIEIKNGKLNITDESITQGLRVVSYIGSNSFKNVGVRIYNNAGNWEEQVTGTSSAATNLIEVSSTDSVWIQYVFAVNDAQSVGGFYDENRELIAPLTYKDWGFDLDAVNKFITPNDDARISIADIEATTGRTVKYVRFVAWSSSAGGQTGTEARIYSQTTGISATAETALKVAELPLKKEVDLFVFSGQSNMMGAAHLEPEYDGKTYYAYEYKYKNRLMGGEKGEFVYAQNPAGEWHYKNPETAYGTEYIDAETGKSKLTNYANNTHFVQACRNGVKEFSEQSEFDHYPSSSIAPYFARYYAMLGNPCIYAHMAKGSTKITHYFTAADAALYNELITDYNANNGTSYATVTSVSGAGDAFNAKYNAMLEDYAEWAQDKTIRNKCLVWLQGESDGGSSSYIEYKLKLQTLWEHWQSLGFTHLFILRVGYWGNTNIVNVIKAQEDFCKEYENCHIVTRAPSLVPYPSVNTTNWWIKEPSSEYANCRDSYLADTTNQHFNEKAHKIFAERSAENIDRILHQGLPPILEDENIKGMVG